jgi:hypothetical protein
MAEIEISVQQCVLSGKPTCTNLLRNPDSQQQQEAAQELHNQLLFMENAGGR